MGGQKNMGFVWTPTKRRGPIAAEFSTPGPAAIGLPSTFGSNAAVKVRSPAFTISGRHDPKMSSASPGPGQYNINGLSHKGKDEPSAPSMHIRPKDPKSFVTPAPGDYCPEKAKKVLDPSPKFSFGIKTDNGNATDVPGPGAYNEAIVDKYKTSKSPAFSMGQRTNIPSDHTQKPGPGAHSPEKCMQDKGPKFTMTGRTTLTEKSIAPGPASYKTPKPDVYLESGPKFSISPRTELPTDKTPKPSPNAYRPEKYRPDEGPKWTLAPRLQELGKSYVPGPGTYEAADPNVYLDKQPVYSMRPKTELPTDKGPRPSPNSYFPEKCMKNRGPKFTMARKGTTTRTPSGPSPATYGIPKLEAYLKSSPKYTISPRTRVPTDSCRPGSNAYKPEKCMQDDGPKWTLAPRLQELSKLNVPGPGAYEAPDLNAFLDQQPVYSMRPRTELPTDKGPRPSPNSYSPEKCMQDKGPKFTLAGRFEEPRKPTLPGPCDYEVSKLNVCFKTSSKCSFSSRTPLPTDKGPKPSPNTYRPKKCMQDDGPKWTLAPRLQELSKLNVPGPGSYEASDLNAFLDQQPAYSMRPRTELPTDKGPKPAPNAYCPEKYAPNEGPTLTIDAGHKENEKSNVPGLGTYEFGDLNAILDQQPVFSMRHKTKISTDESPKLNSNAYSSEKCMQDKGPKFTLAGRFEEPRKPTLPGPCDYEVSKLNVCFKTSPKCSFSSRTSLPTDKGLKPSPNTYRPKKCMQDDGPKWTLAPRLQELSKLNVPGPGSYEASDLNAFLDQQPAYSMRPRTELPTDKGPKPAPNAYCPEKYTPNEGPKWTIAARLKENEKSTVPGPGTYESGDLNAILDKQPAFTMRPKTELPTDKSPKPSPNTYSPEKYTPDDGPKWTMAPKTELPHDKTPKPSPNAYNPDESVMTRRNPEFSFGIKHSPYIGKLRDQ